MFTTLKTSLNVALHRDVHNVAVSYPPHISNSTRKFLRHQLDAAGFIVLSTFRRPWLLDNELEPQWKDECNVLLIELNTAVLEMSLMESDYGVVTVAGYEARVDLAEEVAALKVIEARTASTTAGRENLQDLDQAHARALKTDLVHEWRDYGRITDELRYALPGNAWGGWTAGDSFPRGSAKEKADDMDFVDWKEGRREEAVRSALEAFMAGNTRDWLGRSNYTLPLSEVQVLLSGDASRADFQMVRRAIRGSKMLNEMRRPDGPVAPMYMAAYGAAKIGRLKMYAMCIGCEPYILENREIEEGARWKRGMGYA